MLKNRNETASNRINQAYDNAKSFFETNRGKAAAILLSTLAIGGTIKVADSISVRDDIVAKTDKIQNQKSFFLYTLLKNPESLKTHGACAPELAAEANYYSRVAKTVGQDYGIYEGNQVEDYKRLSDNAKLYRESSKIAGSHNISCYPANSKVSNLTPHFDIYTMKQNHLCASTLQSSPVKDITPEPTKLERDLASADNIKREISIDIAQSQHIAC